MSSIKQIDGYKIYMNHLLGKGSFGAVYVGISDTTGQKVAVKIISKANIDPDQYMKNALFSQIKIMECIKSENVVGFYDVMESSKNYYIVQELCDGDLSKVMTKQGIPEDRAKQYLFQMVKGFLALVREGIIHRDLKPANIMLKKDKIKIGDFGFAKKTQAANKKLNQTIVGSPLYMPLQVLKSEPYSSKCDIWALGFIFYEMLHGQPPWIAATQHKLVEKIQNTKLEINEKLSKDTKDFLKGCLGKTQQQRLSWDQVFAHPIFNGYFLSQSKGNREFQNKLKMIMSDLRFQINSQNIDLCQILAALGYQNGQNELNKQKFFQFLRIISSDITRQASDYIFNKADYDKNGTISINQIERIMNENKINISNVYNKVPGFTKNKDQTQSFTTITPQVQRKIKVCFAKMMKSLVINKQQLQDIFNDYAKDKKGSLNHDQFRKMLKNISPDLDNDEIEAAFGLIDEDNSDSVQFKELKNYYVKVNGIVEMKKKNSSHQIEDEPKYNYGNCYKYPQQPNNYNPFGALMNPNGYYMPPPPMYNYPPNPQFYPPPSSSTKNNGGIFDNYIMNQLSQKLR